MTVKKLWVMVAVLVTLCFAASMVNGPAAQAETSDLRKLMKSDMTDYDPNNVKEPEGDVVKIAIMQPFSGPGAGNGQLYWCVVNWVAHDINKQGGIMVDGKMKKVLFIKGDTMGQPGTTKKMAEKMCLEEKVDVLWGTSGSHLALILQGVAKQYKKIYVNTLAMSNELMEGDYFNKYTFETIWTVSQVGDSLAYFYSTRKEKKFYIICQDYMFGHALADAFKAGLKKFKPEAEIVGEDYHPLFAKDYAPYLTKAKASGADAIFSGDWLPDGGNLLKQARQLGIQLPFANVYMDEPNSLAAVGPEGTVGLVNANQFMVSEMQGFGKAWNNQWKKWTPPYNSLLYKWPGGSIGAALESTYWLIDIIARAGSTDPEKIIKTWEDDEVIGLLGQTLKMRACDHRVVRDTFVGEYVYPNEWFTEAANLSKETTMVIPAEITVIPIPEEDQKRCKK